jgi:hypothetical protein
MEMTSASCVGGSNYRSDQASGHKIQRVFISISRAHVTNVHFTLSGGRIDTFGLKLSVFPLPQKFEVS